MNVVESLLVAAFLFFVGSVTGWCIEVLFRRIFTAKKWINPGFLTGPYLPLYGFGLSMLFAISLIPIKTGYYWLDSILIILIMGVVMTLIEYIAGLIFIKGCKIKLWDYSDPFVIDAVVWFVNNIAFAFVVGIFFGVIAVDFGHSVNLTAKITAFAKKHDIVVSFEKLKESIKDRIEKRGEKKHFVFAFKSGRGINEELDSFKQEQDEAKNKTE